ncbi:MAG: protein kinase [Candidatus Eisenbacteria bacterium]
MPLAPGTRLGAYEIVAPIGAGGMGEVYRAKDLRLGREIALKLLPANMSADPERLARLEREGRAVAGLSHPNIVVLHSIEDEGDVRFLTMELVEGTSLDRALAPGGLPVPQLVELGIGLADALGAAHERGVVHRDLKPSNVMLTSDGRVKVLDFGLAKLAVPASDLEATQAATIASPLSGEGQLLGTVPYMAPEQIRGEETDERTDLFALGIVLYELATGARPFVGATLADISSAILRDAPKPLASVRTDLSADLERIIMRCLEKDPRARFQSAADVRYELRRAGMTPDAGQIAKREIQTPSTLPAERTSFVGRDGELAECRRLFEQSRLLTITGIGGCGKSRLALKVAQGWLAAHPDGIWFVDLAPLTDTGRVAETIAAVLGVREQAGTSPIESLRLHVRGRKLVVVLDNCEHLLSACAAVVDALMDTEVRMLITSREGLGVHGERLFALSPLGVPQAGDSRDLSRVAATEAVQLFVERAQLAQSGFALTAQNSEAIAEICRRLDGIPLALELAAARVKILSVAQILDKLDDRFRLLTGSSRTALPRHQTLHAAIQWSYDQLSAKEKRLFRGLSVFAGGWTLEGASQVAGDGCDDFQMMDLLASLVDKSLVTVGRERQGAPRYGMLESVRQYGRDCLTGEGEAEAVRNRHLDVYLTLAERAYPERYVREGFWSDALELERDNFRAALAHAHESDAERYLALSGNLAWYWQGRSHLYEGHEHLAAALAGAATDPSRPALARALLGAANVLLWQGDTAAAISKSKDAANIWRELGKPNEVGLTVEAIGWAQFNSGDDLAARSTFEECLRIQTEVGDPFLINRARVGLAQVLTALHEVERARPMAREIIAFSASHDDPRSEHSGWHFLADAELIEGKCEESLRLYRTSLLLARGLGDRVETSFEIQGVAMSLIGAGHPRTALRLAAAAHIALEQLGVDLHIRFWGEMLERHLGRARQELGPDASRAEWERGSQLSLDEAVTIALEENGKGT